MSSRKPKITALDVFTEIITPLPEAPDEDAALAQRVTEVTDRVLEQSRTQRELQRLKAELDRRRPPDEPRPSTGGNPFAALDAIERMDRMSRWDPSIAAHERGV